jgi:hypothetical protein
MTAGYGVKSLRIIVRNDDRYSTASNYSVLVSSLYQRHDMLRLVYIIFMCKHNRKKAVADDDCSVLHKNYSSTVPNRVAVCLVV